MKVISGLYRGRSLCTLRGSLTRPTTGKVREAVFSSLQGITEGKTWLDLYAGSGGVGIEALSRGAGYCWFVDNSPQACKVIESNLNKLSIPKDTAKLLCCKAEKACSIIGQNQGTIEIAYLDPPYSTGEEYVKGITSLEPILVPGGIIIIEHRNGFLPQVSYAELIRTRKYGESAVSIFLKGKGD